MFGHTDKNASLLYENLPPEDRSLVDAVTEGVLEEVLRGMEVKPSIVGMLLHPIFGNSVGHHLHDESSSSKIPTNLEELTEFLTTKVLAKATEQGLVVSDENKLSFEALIKAGQIGKSNTEVISDQPTLER